MHSVWKSLWRIRIYPGPLCMAHTLKLAVVQLHVMYPKKGHCSSKWYWYVPFLDDKVQINSKEYNDFSYECIPQWQAIEPMEFKFSTLFDTLNCWVKNSPTWVLLTQCWAKKGLTQQWVKIIQQGSFVNLILHIG